MTELLYVEDDVINAFVIRKQLKNDFQVRHIINPYEALKHVRETPYGVILLDINLGFPDMDGVQLMHEMKKIPHCLHTGFIAVTAYDTPSMLDSFLIEGFDIVHTKPVRKLELIAQIHSLLGVQL